MQLPFEPGALAGFAGRVSPAPFRGQQMATGSPLDAVLVRCPSISLQSPRYRVL